MTLFEAVAYVAFNLALTPAPILTGNGITLVYHLLAEETCQQKNKQSHQACEETNILDVFSCCL